ncbi:MAG: phosphatase PAP2 family protein [Verrucomicrobiota bacterium]|nr:phosphatase PAP2 family protein [Verrucomicrobiota bacterium]
MSLLFLAVYGGCLWITSRRHDVGVFYFAWERSIPFVPFMILPYLSIDLFFVAAPFLFARAKELKVYVLRVTTAIFVAGVCFLLFPLRYAFPRPDASGWLGLLFDAFRTLDEPYNLCPSLHAALLLLLAEAYARHLRGLRRGVVLIWFGLIAFSPVLTGQHHLIDVLAGFLLAALCLRLIGRSFPSLRRRESHKEAAI